MSRRKLFTVGVIAAVLAGVPAISSVPAFAAPRPKSANAKTNYQGEVELLTDATLGGKTVNKGTYTLQADESKISLIADNVLTDSGAIKEIRFGGKTRYLSVQ